jgi:DNA-binding MarR family transcriptional regulator
VTQDDPDLDDASALRGAILRLSRRLQAERSSRSLSIAKISVLAHLLRKGSQTAGELADADRLQPQSMTRVLAELTADGLISRVPNPVDRRQHHLALTAAGRRALAEDMRQRDEWLAGAMARQLTPAERELLARAAELIERLADQPAESSRPTTVHGSRQ